MAWQLHVAHQVGQARAAACILFVALQGPAVCLAGAFAALCGTRSAAQRGPALRAGLPAYMIWRGAREPAHPACAGLANSLLQRQLGSAPMQHAAELAGSVAHSAKSAPASERAALAAVFRRAADRAFNGYRTYITSTPGGWLGAVDPQVRLSEGARGRQAQLACCWAGRPWRLRRQAAHWMPTSSGIPPPVASSCRRSSLSSTGCS